MKLFVTGATGFIGAHFIWHALAEGHEILAHRRTVASAPVIPLPEKVEWVTKPLEEVIESDLADSQVVVHLAATGVTPKPATWDECFRFNTCVSLALMQIAFRAGIKRFVAAGTYAEYGKAGLRFDPIPADAPLEPTDPYAASKAASGMAMAAFSRVNAMEFYYGRIFSAYGDGQAESNFWPQLRAAAIAGTDFPMTTGEQIRDFVPVTQVSAIFLKGCTRGDILAGEPMIRNVASGSPVTLRGFAETWWKHWNATGQVLAGEIAYRPYEVMRYVPVVVE